MGSGQMLLTLGAMMLLGLIILTTNSTMLDNEQVVMDSEFGVAAISLATSLVEEIQGKLYDAAGADSGITSLSKLTASGSLGPSGSERYHPKDSTKTDFNDVDDFNNFWIEFVADTSRPRVATYRGESRGFRADYQVRARVYYVDKNSPDATSFTPTWHKKVVVTVSSPSSRDTLSFPTIISYWN
jgi:hypothetical protein